MNEFEYTIIDTIQVTRIGKAIGKGAEKELIEEQGEAITNALIYMGCDDAIVLDHKVFVRNVEDNNEEDKEDNEIERGERNDN